MVRRSYLNKPIPVSGTAGRGYAKDQKPRVQGKQKPNQVKTRTGCYTCKIRRVKCDEAKPFCKRCRSFGVACDGYPPDTKTHSPPPSRIILPRIAHNPIQPCTQQPLPIQFIYCGPSFEDPCRRVLNTGPYFDDELEAQCFRAYCDNMALQIRGFSSYQTSLWDRLIPQMAETEAYIRHALVAIGAMSKINRPPDDSGGDSDRSVLLHYYPFALKKFDHALKGMRRAITSGDPSIRGALIACLLVVCFESLSGKPSASMNAQSGLALLQQRMDLADGPQRAFLLGGAWSEQGVDADIMIAFTSLDLHVLFFNDTRPDAVHRQILAASNDALAAMPSDCSTLAVAHTYGSLLMRRNYHFLRLVLTASPLAVTGNALNATWEYINKPSWEDALKTHPGTNIFGTPHQPPHALSAAAEAYGADITRWQRATEHLFQQVGSHGAAGDQMVAAQLQIHALMSRIMLAGAFFTCVSQYDALLPEFRTLLSLVEDRYYPQRKRATPPGRWFQFDIGVIAALYLVGTRCCDSSLRQRVVSLLRKTHYREGLWDTLATAEIVGWLLQLEEEEEQEEDAEHSLKIRVGIVVDTSPVTNDRKRAFLTSAVMDLRRRTGIITATVRGFNGHVLREKRVTW